MSLYLYLLHLLVLSRVLLNICLDDGMGFGIGSAEYLKGQGGELAAGSYLHGQEGTV